MPFELIYGMKPNIPNTLQKEPDPIYNYYNYEHELKYRLQTSWKLARENKLNKTKKRIKSKL